MMPARVLGSPSVNDWAWPFQNLRGGPRNSASLLHSSGIWDGHLIAGLALLKRHCLGPVLNACVYNIK
jgi:hypothetical protein